MSKINDILKSISIIDYVKNNNLGTVVKKADNIYRVEPCPICSHKDHLTIYVNSNGEETFTSFNNCCEGGTIADFIMAVDRVDFKEAVDIALGVAGLKGEDMYSEVELEDYTFKDNLSKQERLNKEIILACGIPSSHNAYYFSRGIKEPLIDKYKLGYVDNGYNELVSKIDPSMKSKFKYAYIYKYILPVMDLNGNVESFIARVDEGALNILREEIGDTQKIEKAFNAKTLESAILNAKYLNSVGSVSKDDTYISYRDDISIFVTEGYFDALSFEQSGYHAIALNSAKNKNKLVKILKENYEYIKKFNFILALDNDKSGKDANLTIKSYMDELDLNVTIFDMNGYKDANEFFVKDKDKFIDECKKITNITQFTSMSDFMMNKFLGKAKLKASLGIIPTGMKNLDNLIGGGLYCEEMTIIAAESSVGKTTLALNIANNIAEQGTDVLIFAVEQGEMDLGSKLLSRFSFERQLKDKVKITDAMNNGFSYSARKLSYIQDIEEYQLEELLVSYSESKASQYLYVREQNMAMSLDFIKNEVKRFVKATGRTPVVVIDYLQNVEVDDYRLSDKQKTDKVVKELKILARDLTLPMIVISSVNRGSYYSRLTFSALKESGSIEFSADNVITLNLSVIDDIAKLSSEAEKKNKYMEAKGSAIREIDADILKQRNGEVGVTAKLAYIPRYNYYTSK